MKANEAPEKIHVSKDLFRWSFGMPSDKNDIEYTRTDAFIERAIGWIDYNNRNGGCNFNEWEKDFKNYMEGE